jgi:asparagine synthase (glutamine-hydrolysing)
VCGIAGFYAFEREGALAEDALRRMVDAMRHRGPDHMSVHVRGKAGLGMSRLAIIDPEGSNQPIYGEAGDVWLVFNGEIYNYVELRVELEKLGHVFKTRGDGEVIVHGYEQWGEDFIDRLNGMFAIALRDEKSDRLLLARDRMGIKPLYLLRGGKRVLFASEVKAVIASGTYSPGLRRDLLDCQLALRYVPAPDCIFEGITKLMPGECIVCSPAGEKSRSYYRPVFQPRIELGEEEAAAEILELMKSSISLRLRSDVPLGVFLSGGLDSSFITALVREQVEGTFNSYSVGFDRGGIYNELGAASEVAKRFGTEPHELLMDQARFFTALPDAVYYMEEPMADPSSVPMMELARIARRDVKVVLSGEGGDELFFGYGRHLGEMWASKFFFPSFLAGPAGRLASMFLGRRPARGLKGVGIKDPVLRHLHWETIVGADSRRRLLAEGPGDASPVSAIARAEEQCPSPDPMDRLSWIDLRLWLVEDLLLKKDKMGMSASIEARVPFLDHNLVDFACRLDPSLKIRRGERKYVLRKVIGRYLGPDLMSRPKVGFAVPIGDWFRDESKKVLRELLLSERTFLDSCMDSRAVRVMLETHAKGKDLSLEIFLLLVLELWGRIFIMEENPRDLGDRIARLLGAPAS